MFGIGGMCGLGSLFVFLIVIAIVYFFFGNGWRSINKCC